MSTLTNHHRKSKRPPRRGAAIIVCIFVILVMSIMVISAIKMQTSRMASVRNTAAYEQSLYVAGAAAHHALAELEADASWRDGFTNIEFPSGSGHTYSATISDGVPDGVIIDASGTADGITRKLQLTVSTEG